MLNDNQKNSTGLPERIIVPFPCLIFCVYVHTHTINGGVILYMYLHTCTHTYEVIVKVSVCDDILRVEPMK